MFRSRRYRYDNEQVVLVITLLLVLAVIVLTSTLTFCLSGVFVIAMFVLSAFLTRLHHQSLIQNAFVVDAISAPELNELVEECALKLQPGAVDVFLAGKNQMNAYTFGLGTPKVLVLYKPLIQVMTSAEFKFVIGHEMGHIALGHTWLITIVGGMAGVPAPFGAAVLLYAAFRWWNRMCEFSVDRAGLLACGDLHQSISALVKLAAPEIRSQGDFDRALALIDAEDDAVSNRLAEVFQSHPMLIRRINKLRAYARTAEYQHLQEGVNRNMGLPPSGGGDRMTSQEGEKTRPRPEEVSKKSPEERWPWLKR